MLHVYRSNRIEALAAVLAAQLRQAPLADPMEADVVVVASRGLQRWLSQTIAHELGVAANFEFPFPASVVRTIVAAAVQRELPEQDPWATDAMAWSILAELPNHLANPKFAALNDYLGPLDGPIDRRQWSLARRVADVFDRYLTFRPKRCVSWGKGDPLDDRQGERAWQPVLFHALCARINEPHPAQRLLDAVGALQRGSVELRGVPSRISLFGLTAVPPAWLELLGALGAHRTLDLYLLCPSDRYWADIRRRRALLEPQVGSPEGHPLLVSFGRLARDFQYVLEDRADTALVDRTDDELFIDPAPQPWSSDQAPGHMPDQPPTMLQKLQSDVVHLRHPTERDAARSRLIHPLDTSLQFHACHGATRQVEVLRDVLLHLLANDPKLEPRDILVVTPDIEAFAPLITAVFSDGAQDPNPQGELRWGPSGSPRLRFQVADRSLRAQNPVAEALLATLDLANGRLPASAVLDLLALEPVRSRFGLSATDLVSVQQWVIDSRIRWGADADHRTRENQPATDANTWRFGLDRALLGVAMPDNGASTFGGVLPLDPMEGSHIRALGPFVAFVHTLFEQLDALSKPRPLAAWAEQLERTLVAMTTTEPGDVWLTQQVRDRLADLVHSVATQAFEGPVDLDAMRAFVGDDFKVGRASIGQQTGAITFAQLVPMRSIPFKVVALLGMDDGAFPRTGASLGFDRLANEVRPGDRSPRDEDRFLFLEAVLSARQALIVLWSGRSPRSNEEQPPAVPVGELLDIAVSSFDVAEGTVVDRLVTRHPLQAFSPVNFNLQQPFSADTRLLQGARRLLGPRVTPAPFFQGELPAKPMPQLHLDTLVQFFQHPARFLLKHSLDMRLGDDLDKLQDREPIELAGLDNWQLGQDTLHRLESGGTPQQAKDAARAGGELPFGAPGELAIDNILQQASSIHDDATRDRQGPRRRVDVDIELGDVRLVGSLDGVFGSRLIHTAYSRVGAKHRLAGWVRHLALCASLDAEQAQSVVIGRNPETKRQGAYRVVFKPIDALVARNTLQELVSVFDVGRRGPVPLITRTSYIAAKAMQRGGGSAERTAMYRARQAYEGGFQQPGESDDPWMHQAFEGADPLTELQPTIDGHTMGFLELSARVWHPILEATR